MEESSDASYLRAGQNTLITMGKGASFSLV